MAEMKSSKRMVASKIVSAYVSKENLKWLEDNENTVLEFLAKEHSPISLAHTMLHMDSFDDTYIETMKKKIASRDRALLKERKARPIPVKQAKSAEDIKKTKNEKKKAIFETAVTKNDAQDEAEAAFLKWNRLHGGN
jgi:hypothetical protein